MADEERRRWKRLRSELRLQLQIIDLDSGGRTVTAIGSHLNPMGLFVQMADPPPEGTRVKVTLAAEGTDGVLTAEGKVVTRHVLADDTKQPPGCGISLDQTGPAWQKLYDWLNEDSEPDPPVET